MDSGWFNQKATSFFITLPGKPTLLTHFSPRQMKFWAAPLLFQSHKWNEIPVPLKLHSFILFKMTEFHCTGLLQTQTPTPGSSWGRRVSDLFLILPPLPVAAVSGLTWVGPRRERKEQNLTLMVQWLSGFGNPTGVPDTQMLIVILTGAHMGSSGFLTLGGLGL